MRNRLVRLVGVLMLGCCLQASCGNVKVGEILAQGIQDTAVAVSSFAVGTVVGNAFGFQQ